MLTSATGVYGKAVAEHSFAMLLMLQKKLNLTEKEFMQGIKRLVFRMLPIREPAAIRRSFR